MEVDARVVSARRRVLDLGAIFFFFFLFFFLPAGEDWMRFCCINCC